MMAKAKQEKENAQKGIYDREINKEENEKFYEDVAEIAEKRFQEKKENKEHDDKVDLNEISDVKK